MTSDEIRERFLSYFAERGHHRLPSAPLVPRNDPSTLLISAGMHPLKPYFLGVEAAAGAAPDHGQKCFRTVDIDNIGRTYRHLTFFEMLGNFSIGDYFKQGAVEFAWDFSLNGFGFEPERDLGHDLRGRRGARPRARPGGDRRVARRSASRASGSSRSAREDNFWQAGPTGPVRAVQRALPRPRAGVRRRPTSCPAPTASASWSTGTSCSCSTTRSPRAS